MFIVFLVVALLSVLTTKYYIKLAQKKKWLDVPNQRSSHTEITPRGGGLVFMSIWLICAILMLLLGKLNLQDAAILLPGSIIVAAVGFYDDRYHLSAKYRGIFYFTAAILSIVALKGFDHLLLGNNIFLPLGFFGAIFAVLAIVWSTNLFNFMDGIDAIAAVEALFVLVIGGTFLWVAGGVGVATLAWLLASAVAGFLVWNKPRAKVFMGDVGSATLGFIVMVLAFIGEKQYNIPVILWFILYGVFLFDATVTLLRRIVKGEVWYEAHRSHAYQRLHQAGWSHGKIVLALIMLNTVLVGLSWAGYCYRDMAMFLALIAYLILGGIYWRIERIKPMY